MQLQALLPNGSFGPHGHIAWLLVEKAWEWGPEDAVNQILEAMIRALEIQRRLKNVLQLNVPVILNIYNNSHNEKVCYFNHNSYIHNYLIILQPFLLSGNPGANGLIVRQRVAMDPELGAVVAGNHLLEAMILALATQQRLKTATHPNVPVIFYNNSYGSSLLV